MKRNHKILISFTVLALIFAVVTNTPSLQRQIKPFFEKDDREVLAKVTGFYGTDQNQVMVLKIRHSKSIMIEIYEIKDVNTSELRQKFELSDDSDAYVTIDKSSTNLALSDVDKDGFLDIIAPSVDRNGNLRLNTFRYNVDLTNFEPYVNSNQD